MAAKFIVAFCAQALFIQSAFSQCAPGLAAPYGLNGLTGYNSIAGSGGYNGMANSGGYNGLASSSGYNGLAGSSLPGPYGAGCGYSGVASTGGGFPVTSISPLTPTGLSIISENAIEGSLTVGGSLPFLATVVLDGVLPTSGSGAVSYGCGNEGVGIVSDGPISSGIVGPGYGPSGSAAYGPAGAAFGPGIIGAPAYNGLGGCGCGAVY